MRKIWSFGVAYALLWLVPGHAHDGVVRKMSGLKALKQITQSKQPQKASKAAQPPVSASLVKSSIKVAQVSQSPTVKATTNMKELAEKLIVFWRNGQFAEGAAAHYDQNIVSVEGSGDTAKGLTAVRDKSQWWQDNYAIHSVKVEGPFLGKNGFVVFLDIDMTPKDTGKRTRMREAATYVVENGKVVREEFFDLAE